MLLTFIKPEFENLIKKGIKIHTIRADKGNRWKVGTKIHFWSGNPRNSGGKNKPYAFGVGVVKQIVPIIIFPDEDKINIGYGNLTSKFDLDYIAKCEGFINWDKMKEFFPEKFEGKVILWKDCVWY